MRDLVVHLAGLALASTLAAQAQLVVPLSPQGRSAGGCAMSGPATPLGAEQKQALAFRNTRVEGRALRRGVGRVTGQMRWHNNLKTAARAATASGRPIVWIHALGSLRGYT